MIGQINFNNKGFLSSVPFLVGLHALIGVFFIITIQYFFLHAQKEIILEDKRSLVDVMESDISVLKTNNSYLDTDEFKELQAKKSNYKKSGERVISTLSIELDDEALESYAPAEGKHGQDNVSLWVGCFMQVNQDCID